MGRVALEALRSGIAGRHSHILFSKCALLCPTACRLSSKGKSDCKISCPKVVIRFIAMSVIKMWPHFSSWMIGCCFWNNFYRILYVCLWYCRVSDPQNLVASALSILISQASVSPSWFQVSCVSCSVGVSRLFSERMALLCSMTHLRLQ